MDIPAFLPSDNNVAYEQLRAWLQARAVVRRGGIKLRSGGESNFYIDGRKVAMWSAGLRLLGRLLYDRIMCYRPTSVGGLATAAIPLVTAVLLEAGQRGHDLEGFYVRTEAKRHGLQRRIEGYQPTSEDNVVVLEDVVTTGASAIAAIEAIQPAKATAVVCVVDRSAGAYEAIGRCGAELQALFAPSDLLSEHQAALARSR